jgi:RHS repeat-associated protein
MCGVFKYKNIVNMGSDPDRDGQLTKRTWARGTYTDYVFDNAGRKTLVNYSDSTPDISFTYDWMGNTPTVTDAAGTHNFTYDYTTTGHPGLTSVTVPHILNHKIDYTYDGMGRRTAMSLLNDTTPVMTDSYTYDVQNRLATLSDGTNTAEYTRQAGTGLLTGTEIKHSGTTVLHRTRTYDQYKRLASIANTAGSVTKSHTYTYNDKDQRTKIALADSSYWDYTYDDKGQVITGIKRDSADKAIPGYSFGFDYDDIGNRVTAKRGTDPMTTIPNGSGTGNVLNTIYTSNNLNQYTIINNPGYAMVTGEAAEDANVAVRDEGNTVARSTRDGKYFTSMLPVNNSAAAIEKMLSIYFCKFDNVQDKDILTVIHRTVKVPKAEQAYTYDDDGNMLTNGDWTYTWNAENRLVQAESANKKLEFVYDYMGRRISKKVYTGSTGNWTLSTEQKFAYDGYLQIAEFDGSDSIQKSYVWAGSSTMEWQKDHVNNKYHYSLYDANKNIVGTVDVAGTLTSEYEYSPFGKIFAQSGTYADENKFRLSSECQDAETELVYYNFRYYNPELGRWLSRDPIDEKGGIHLYGMVNNNPVNKWDELGLKTKSFLYAITLWDWDFWAHDVVMVFNYGIEYSCIGGKVNYTPHTSKKAFDLQGAYTDSGINDRDISGDGSVVEFTLWAAASWKEFNAEAGKSWLENHLKKGGHIVGIDTVILSVGLGVYIAKGNFYARKKVAAFSKKVTVNCCLRKTPKVKIGTDNYIKDGDFYWEHDVKAPALRTR